MSPPREKGEQAIGEGFDRVDGPAKVTGHATYAAEFEVAGLVHAALVTSPIAVGHVGEVDDKDAKAVPGVLAVLSAGRAPKLPEARGPASGEGGPAGRVLQLLQDEAILYNDHPLAVVVATTWEAAQEAAHKLKITTVPRGAPRLDLRDKAAIYTPKKLMDGPPEHHRGNFEAVFAGAPVKLDLAYTTPWQNHNPMEPHATIAVWHGPDALTIYEATQGIFAVQKRLAAIFGLEPAAVRVLSPYVGGGFGCKGTPWSHIALAALAAKTVGKPVRLVLERSQMFSLVGHRPATHQHLRVAALADGTLTGLAHEGLTHTSSFDEFIENCTAPTRMMYACPNLLTTQRLARLDIPTPTFMRAPGEATGNFALECAMDELAYAVKKDPLALRLLNYAERDPEKDVPWTSKSLRACYEAGAARFGWSRRPAAPRSLRDGPRLVGWGMATASYPTRRSKAAAVAVLGQDGRALVQAGTQDIGTGTYTIMAQVAADALRMPFAQVRFELGDTRMPQTPVSGGSQTAASVGSAVKDASTKLRQMLLALAGTTKGSPFAGKSPEELDARDGRVFLKDNVAGGDSKKRAPSLGYAELLKAAGKTELRAEGQGEPDPKTNASFSAHSFGATFAEVKVDEELGEARVTRLVGAFAAGQILNAKTARSQLQGGMVWGVGFALHEHTEIDPRNGRVMTRDLADYHVPVNADIPDIEVLFMDEDDPHVNPVGTKGVGELGITGTVAAIANAIFHATGKRIRDLPITPDKLL